MDLGLNLLGKKKYLHLSLTLLIIGEMFYLFYNLQLDSGKNIYSVDLNFNWSLKMQYLVISFTNHKHHWLLSLKLKAFYWVKS